MRFRATSTPTSTAIATLMLLVAAVLTGCSTPGHASAAPSTPVPSASPSVRPASDAGWARRLPGATRPGTVPSVIDHGPRWSHRIALTFDSNMTDAMLHKLATGKVASYANVDVVDELQRLRVPATFFLAGKWIQAYPALTRRLAADPAFELASHSWAHEGFRAHCYGLGTLPRAAMADDIRTSFRVLDRYTTHPTRYFRFPGGCYDAAALRAIAPVGCTVVEYDDVSGDAFGTSVRAIERQTLAEARNGGIVVLHITLANAPLTAQALPEIVAGLRARGYDLVTLSHLLAGSASPPSAGAGSVTG